MGAGGGERVEGGNAAEATGATGIGHHGVEDVVVDGVVIAAENLARSATALRDGDSGGKINEIEGVGCGGGESAGGDLLLQERLDGGVVDCFSRRGSGNGERADEQAAGDLLVGDAVFGELVEKLAGENEIEELVEFGKKGILRGGVPFGAPEHGEHLHGGEERAVAVAELRSNLGSGGFGFAG